MQLQLPSGADLATTYGNNSIIEFYISQCGILQMYGIAKTSEYIQFTYNIRIVNYII